MFIVVQFMGIGNYTSVFPFVASERIIVYGEGFAGMYSSWFYSFGSIHLLRVNVDVMLNKCHDSGHSLKSFMYIFLLLLDRFTV